ncbi:putative cytochrome P450 hydroxylase [[Actinomadura] parvosata subsp. kistnae]|uniref:Cytochrome n=1 Tax=[Actinomadura] parvosata subsp. kistnae TaxID=1909395 RepID=A0A1V0AAF5_9ACTN|nr:cytochrome P450 [Nonomuraea sp. ATCC 55076]AQZ67204.1 cytochrome [Nonomuraea sp. ATCC 55076]SPL94583.1 putative cytochrome P450 hydroxylase [Actinomadura parvosata subsp. kistnae]
MTEIPRFPMRRAEKCPFDPPPQLRDLQRDAPLVRVRLWNGSTPWLVTRHAEQRALLSDPRLSADLRRPGYPHMVEAGPEAGFSFILMDDPEHARLRRMVTAPLTTRRAQALRPVTQEIVDGLIDDLLAGPKPVDLVEAFALPVPSLVICRLLGVPYEDHGFFQANSRILIKHDVTFDERAQAGLRITQYLGRLMARKTADPGDDLLSELAQRVAAGELAEAEAMQMGVLILLAGHETTTNMIALGTLALLEHPGQLAALRAGDAELTVSAVEELLRYLTITHQGLRRVATEDIEIAGLTVRAGEGVVLDQATGNRDPDAFPGDPDRLDLRRDARRHVAFGYGVHQCLGQQLARMELQVVLGTLYRRIPTLRAAVGLEEIPFKEDGLVYGVYELPVAW